MSIRATLGIDLQTYRRQQDVVVDDKRTVIDLDKNIFQGTIVVQQVTGDTRALAHPVEPDSARRPEDMVIADQGIDGAVELDPGHFVPAK